MCCVYVYFIGENKEKHEFVRTFLLKRLNEALQKQENICITSHRKTSEGKLT